MLSIVLWICVHFMIVNLELINLLWSIGSMTKVNYHASEFQMKLFYSYPFGACQQINNHTSCHFNQCAVWSFSGEQLFSVCSRWDRDYAAIFHSRINSTVMTRLDHLRICAYLRGLSPFCSLKQPFNVDCPWLPNVPCLHICQTVQLYRSKS